MKIISGKKGLLIYPVTYVIVLFLTILVFSASFLQVKENIPSVDYGMKNGVSTLIGFNNTIQKIISLGKSKRQKRCSGGPLRHKKSRFCVLCILFSFFVCGAEGYHVITGIGWKRITRSSTDPVSIKKIFRPPGIVHYSRIAAGRLKPVGKIRQYMFSILDTEPSDRVMGITLYEPEPALGVLNKECGFFNLMP